jgi:hypothetical protein
MIAFADESMRMTGDGLYVVAAVVVTSDALHECRGALRGAVPRKIARFHWRNEREAIRVGLLTVAAGLPVIGLASVLWPADRRQQERARAIALRHLLWNLKQRGVAELVIESREPELNSRDRRTIAHAQRAGWADQELRYDFGPAVQEPMLWLADAFAGAVRASVGEADDHYLDLLPEGVVSIQRVDP